MKCNLQSAQPRRGAVFGEVLWHFLLLSSDHEVDIVRRQLSFKVPCKFKLWRLAATTGRRNPKQLFCSLSGHVCSCYKNGLPAHPSDNKHCCSTRSTAVPAYTFMPSLSREGGINLFGKFHKTEIPKINLCRSAQARRMSPQEQIGKPSRSNNTWRMCLCQQDPCSHPHRCQQCHRLQFCINYINKN